MIKKSWRTVDIQSEAPTSSDGDEAESTLTEKLSKDTHPTDVSSLMMSLYVFTPKEKVYICEVLFPSEDIQNHIVNRPRQFRMCIREKLSLTIEEENDLRQNIKLKLEELNR